LDLFVTVEKISQTPLQIIVELILQGFINLVLLHQIAMKDKIAELLIGIKRHVKYIATVMLIVHKDIFVMLVNNVIGTPIRVLMLQSFISPAPLNPIVVMDKTV